MESAYSRTADAESVVLNFAKVLTYSRVLLYTLRERRKGRDGTGVGGVGIGGPRRGEVNDDTMSVQYKKMDGESMTGVAGKVIGE
jgi:hypothetical protein